MFGILEHQQDHLGVMEDGQRGAVFQGIVYIDACKKDGSVPEIIINQNSVGPWIFKLHKESTRGIFLFAFNYVNIWTCKSTSHTTWHVVVSIPIEHYGIGIHNFANISSSSTCLGLVQFPQNCVFYEFYVFFSFLQFWEMLIFLR